jgi:hypothetical protein
LPAKSGQTGSVLRTCLARGIIASARRAIVFYLFAPSCSSALHMPIADLPR